jgi:outer membrane protein assembly factor BamD (BamD/ComL family)
MNRTRLLILVLPTLLIACQTTGDKDTIAELRQMQVEIKEAKIEGGLDKAMGSYQRYLEEMPDSALAPEAMRRLADLKIEKEYGTLPGGGVPEGQAKPAASQSMARPPRSEISARPGAPAAAPDPAYAESEKEFETRATRSRPVDPAAVPMRAEGADDLDRASTREAIALYKKLLNDHPLYERNDQVLYQMSRAYEELGRTQEAMAVMDRLVAEYPRSRYLDEVQFRRAEYFFPRKRYLDAEDAYASIVKIGPGSFYYELALYKLGWTYYKQELYEEALHRFIALLDHKVSTGYDFEQTTDEPERKRTQDTFRVISLSFSNLGGPPSVVATFSRLGKRTYEASVYRNLGEFYFDKRRYADASATYNAFVSRNPFHKLAPNFQMRVIEIHSAGGFPSLVLEAKKTFATTYSLKAAYWKHFQPDARPDVLDYLKTNLTDLANHYHASYQQPQQAEDKPAHFKEALHWYRQYLSSFPAEKETAGINYQLADLLLENRSFGPAAVEYEKTAYDYPAHEKSSQAGYAAVYAYREQLAASGSKKKDAVKKEVVRISLKFADSFPQHEKAAIVLGAAADDLYAMEAYGQALAAAGKLTREFAGAEVEVVRAAWLVVGHSSYELEQYGQAENAYLKVLSRLPEDDKSRSGLLDNLAASIYQQGEQARTEQDFKLAAHHFLRVGMTAPDSKIRPTAQYDGAAALIQLKDWKAAADVLGDFRQRFPGHELQPEVTKKLAYVYRQDGRLSLAAGEYERIEKQSQDDEIRREALLVAGQLYTEDGRRLQALAVYQRYVGYFPQPVEVNLETRDKIADILKAQNDRPAYLDELRQIVAIEAAAKSAQTPRTRYLAAKAGLVLAEDGFAQFTAVRLVQPFKPNLLKKRSLMKTAVQQFSRLMDYELGEFTAAATFYLAEIYDHFSKALMKSERPQGLTPLEEEQYELAIEDQAYPFEEKAIEVHQSNLELISRGVYNRWIEKSLQKLSVFLPARYDKPEQASAVIGSLETYMFVLQGAQTPVPSASATQDQPAALGRFEDPGANAPADPAASLPAEESGSTATGRSVPSTDQPGALPEAALQGQNNDREDVLQ